MIDWLPVIVLTGALFTVTFVAGERLARNKSLIPSLKGLRARIRRRSKLANARGREECNG